MPQFIIQVFKTHPLEVRPWSNRYIVEATSLAEASAQADTIAQAERVFHNQSTLFTYARTSSVTEGDSLYTTTPLNLGGLRADPTDNLPLWNVVRVDVTVLLGGRPSRKYYRLPLGENDVNNYIIIAGTQNLIGDAVNSLITTMIAASTPIVDPDGQDWFSATVVPRVAMRQLHRKRRRRPAA